MSVEKSALNSVCRCKQFANRKRRRPRPFAGHAQSASALTSLFRRSTPTEIAFARSKMRHRKRSRAVSPTTVANRRAQLWLFLGFFLLLAGGGLLSVSDNFVLRLIGALLIGILCYLVDRETRTSGLIRTNGGFSGWISITREHNPKRFLIHLWFFRVCLILMFVGAVYHAFELIK